jgi:adenylate cyclase
VDRLPTSLRDALRTASVQGEAFAAEVLARAKGIGLRAMIASLSGELDRRHRLVRAEGVQPLAGGRISYYRFRHFLFQKYLYDSLDDVERVHLHEQVGVALEELCRGSDNALASAAPQLAWHFELAKVVDEAVRYYEIAGRRAIRMLAYQEALAHLTRGLELLEQLPASRERDRRELELRLAVAMPIFAMKSWGASELAEHYRRAEILAEKLGDAPHQLQVMSLARGYHLVRAEHRRSLGISKRFYALAQRLEDPLQIMVGHCDLSVIYGFVGDFKRSARHAEQFSALYDPGEHGELRYRYGQDLKVTVWVFAIYSLWYRGYPDEALRVSEEAVALAEHLEHPLSVSLALEFKARLHRWRRELDAVEALVPRQHQAAVDYDMPLSEVGARLGEAWLTSERGQPVRAIALYKEALAFWESTGMGNHLSEFHGVLAQMHGKAGQADEGLRLIEDAMAFVERTEERYHEAELHRLRGEIRLLKHGNLAGTAAEDFRTAIEIAQAQGARMLELRAAMSLCRLRRDYGTEDELAKAQVRLAEVYDGFTEGFDTQDLQEARALLDSPP